MGVGMWIAVGWITFLLFSSKWWAITEANGSYGDMVQPNTRLMSQALQLKYPHLANERIPECALLKDAATIQEYFIPPPKKNTPPLHMAQEKSAIILQYFMLDICCEVGAPWQKRHWNHKGKQHHFEVFITSSWPICQWSKQRKIVIFSVP